MIKIRILIIEDEPEQGQILRETLEEKGYEVTAVATNLKDGLGFFYAQKPDIVIIDVYLDGKPDGIVFAERINENPATLKPFVFLTSAVDRGTFEAARLTKPYSYLIKPFNTLELEYALELALEKFTNTVGLFSSGQIGATLIMEAFFLIKKRDTLVKVPFDHIEFIEVEGKYATIFTEDDSFLIEISLKLLFQKLPEKQFIQIHRNHVVNLNKVKKLHLADNQMELISGKKITISRRYKDQFVERYSVLK
ncbi:LytR/AlgR family response regulator transcription factor [Flavobacterium sp. '19STA2R22 D10 B1']|uniref:LytR/AlgR family response regulator transcription factor n=1 Tax=Flavobacterium aerium TaxID=3037261 RepID=UPI00278C068C|nr:response regulator transcription factor [Flavobacterium sp. '19STA2R22 D10 B1']